MIPDRVLSLEFSDDQEIVRLSHLLHALADSSGQTTCGHIIFEREDGTALATVPTHFDGQRWGGKDPSAYRTGTCTNVRWVLPSGSCVTGSAVLLKRGAKIPFVVAMNDYIVIEFDAIPAPTPTHSPR